MSHIVKILSERHRETATEYTKEFNLINGDGGYSFPCDKDGNLIPDENYDCLLKSYERCLNDDNYEYVGIKKRSWSWTEPAVAKCSCGAEIQLIDEYMGACECECGQWYNMFGQSLINPEYWEEEY